MFLDVEILCFLYIPHLEPIILARNSPNYGCQESANSFEASYTNMETNRRIGRHHLRHQNKTRTTSHSSFCAQDIDSKIHFLLGFFAFFLKRYS